MYAAWYILGASRECCASALGLEEQGSGRPKEVTSIISGGIQRGDNQYPVSLVGTGLVGTGENDESIPPTPHLQPSLP